MAEFDPRQLDQLEDALERIDDLDDLESLELSAELTERLGEYQDVLALCREVFPIEAPSDALLAEVIAEAHEVTRRSRPMPKPTWRRFWDRWRGTLIPGFALAGSAAAILLLLEPDPSASSTTSLWSNDDDASERSRPEPDDSPSKPAGEQALDEPTPALDTSPATLGQDTNDDANEAPASDDTPSKKRKKAAVEPEPAPAPEPVEPLSKDATWDLLPQAHDARHKGRCDQARKLYEQIIAASSDQLATAQAKAGIGLCLEQQGRSGADALFDQARASRPGIDAWIEQERDDQPQPGEFDSKQQAEPEPALAKKKAVKKTAPSKKY